MWVSSEKKSKYGNRKRKDKTKIRTKVALSHIVGGRDARTNRMNGGIINGGCRLAICQGVEQAKE
jgi:hypothetical protein